MKSGSVVLLTGLLALWARPQPAAGQSHIVKLGRCPMIPPGTVGTCIHGCDHDGDCPGVKKCCSNGCGQECMEPIRVKPGFCPRFIPGAPGICVFQCTHDGQCPGTQKCCHTGCGHVCVDVPSPEP
ncbi:WAP four-disulfide core domain protein 18 [Alligator mississippiensis]|uniref:WAP domain-containing protein n=1 Tax=Alligator mississippiensis TaxID=8496 RepID=A0A151M3K8_ALLMI|nr:WAP four-disulfide core domain protein 18 [Alligator mississippiensis]KYO19109.1 hypothetical protein Y1Q_0017089 [Alligator mississippiensis]